MKRIAFILLLLATLAPVLVHALLVTPFTDLDAYIKHGKTIFIGQCLPIEDAPLYKGVVCRKMRVLNVLQGTLKTGDDIFVLVLRPLVPGNLYLVFSGSEGLDENGQLNAYSYEPGATEIQLWGEITKAEREQRISKFLKMLEGKTLKKKLLAVFEMRRGQLMNEGQLRKEELDVLERTLKSK